MLSVQHSSHLLSFFSTGNKYVPIPNRVALKKYAHVSVYKRDEPQIGINFIAEESKHLLKDCLNEQTANTFFELIDQFQTQSDPSYCGPTNLMAVLNTLNVDPKTKWKGIWRWYDEDMIKCLNIERIKDFGMTLNEFSLILKCNGVKAKVYRPNCNDKINTNTAKADNAIKSNSIRINKIDVNTEDLGENYYSCINHMRNCLNQQKKIMKFSYADYPFFQAAALASTKLNNFFLMCNLGRGGLQQTGDGHYTPLAAFHQKANLGLLLESARFKYNSRWYDLRDIYNSLTEKDKLSDLPRGFLLIQKNKPNFVKVNSNSIPLSLIKESYSVIDRCLPYNFLTLDQKAFLINYFMKNKINGLNDKSKDQILMKTLTHFNCNSNNFKSLAYFMYQFDNSNLVKNLLHILTNPNTLLLKGI